MLVAGVALLVSGGEPRRQGADGKGAESRQATVTRVVDGDTIQVELDGEDEDVRYIGVDTPESSPPASRSSASAGAPAL